MKSNPFLFQFFSSLNYIIYRKSNMVKLYFVSIKYRNKLSIPGINKGMILIFAGYFHMHGLNEPFSQLFSVGHRNSDVM